MRQYSFQSNVHLLTTSRQPSGAPSKPFTAPRSQSRVPGGAAPPPRAYPPAARKTRSAEPERPSAAPGRACSVGPQVWLYSEAGRGRRPLPPRAGVGRSGHFILLGNLLPFEPFVSPLRPPTARPSGSGGAGSVDLPRWVGAAGWHPTNHSPLSPNPGREAGEWFGEVPTVPQGVCAPDAPRPPSAPHGRGTPAPEPARRAPRRRGLSSSHPPSAPSLFLNDWRREDTSDGGGRGCHSRPVYQFLPVGPSPAPRASGLRRGRPGARVMRFK